MNATRAAERRVFSALDSLGGSVEVVALVAPAGSGKTTAIRAWLDARAREHRWLDAGGADSVASLAAMLSSLPPGLLVVDDSHHLRRGPHLQRLVEEANSTGWRIIVAGRSEPPTSFWRLVGRGKAVMVGLDELLLAPEDLASWADRTGVDLDDELIAELHETTMGWPALVGIVLAETARVNLSGPIRALEYTEAGQYVRAEVIEQLHPDLRAFCARLALLGTFTAELAQEALETRSDDQLDRAWRSQTMLVRAPGSDQEFTFPPIATTALLRDLAGPGPDETTHLHRRASLWYEARGDWDRALPHMLRASPTDSVRQLGRMRTAMEPHGRSEEALRWFGQLPQRLRMQPRPVIGLVFALVQAGLAEEARQLLDQIDPSTWQRTDQRAELAMAEATVERMLVHHAATVTAAELSLALLDEVDPAFIRPARLSYLRVMAAEQLREVRLWEGDTVAVRELMSVMQHDVIRSELELSLVHSTAVTAIGALDSGDLGAAAEKARSALRLAERREYQGTHLVAEALFVLSAVALEHDENESAIEQLEKARALAGDGIFPTTQYRIELLLAPALARAGRRTEARSILEELGAMARRSVDPVLAARLLAATALVDLHGNDVRSARAAYADLRSVSAPPGVLRIRALLAARLGLTADLAALADQLTDDRTGPAEPIDVVVASIARARSTGTPDSDQALDYLLDALRRAEELDLWRTVLDLAGDLSPLLGRARERADLVRGPAPGYVRRIATSVAASSRTQSVLSERETEIAQFLPSRKSNAQIAADLFISENTVKTHLRHIYEKLGVDQRDRAVERLRELGLLARDH